MTLDIMMPFYGRFDQMQLAVGSVLAQTSPDWRLVVVDDVYPDRAPGRWVDAIVDPRVQYLRNPSNLGVSGNFNRCAELMTSEFGVLMGCDDIMLPRFVARATELIAEFPSADLIQPGVSVIDGAGSPSRPLADRVKALYRFRGTGARAYRGEQLAASLVRGNWAYFPSVIWRAERLKTVGFRSDLLVAQDLALMLEIILRGGTLVLDDELVFQYRRHADSVSAIGGADGSKFIQERALFEQFARDLRAHGWSRAARIADHHLSSRLNALAELPAALRAGNQLGSRVLANHVLGTRFPTD